MKVQASSYHRTFSSPLPPLPPLSSSSFLPPFSSSTSFSLFFLFLFLSSYSSSPPYARSLLFSPLPLPLPFFSSCRCQRRASCVMPQIWFMRRGFHWLGTSQGTPCFHVPSAGIKMQQTPCQGFLHRFWGLNSGPYTCVVSTLQPEPAPQPRYHWMTSPSYPSFSNSDWSGSGQTGSSSPRIILLLMPMIQAQISYIPGHLVFSYHG